MKKYKHKLNMLEPGIRMLQIIGILLLLGLVCYLLGFLILCRISIGIAAVIGLILFILLLIEQHQDKVLNRQAIQERSHEANFK